MSLKHFKFRIPITGYMDLYMAGINSYDAMERLKNGESGACWTEIYNVQKFIDQAEILSESNVSPQWLFTDIKNIRVQITKEVEELPGDII